MLQTLIRSVQIVKNHARLDYSWWPRRNFVYLCDPLKGHWRSYNDMRWMCVFACIFLLSWDQSCNLWRNPVKLRSFSGQLIQPYLEELRRTGIGLLEVREFLRMKFDDLWLPVQKSSTSVCQRSGRCWHPARAATGCEQNGGNLNQLRHKLQPWLR